MSGGTNGPRHDIWVHTVFVWRATMQDNKWLVCKTDNPYMIIFFLTISINFGISVVFSILFLNIVNKINNYCFREYQYIILSCYYTLISGYY